MPDIEVTIEIFCARCGGGLCNNTTAGRTRGRGQEYFDVEPCAKCLEAEDGEGYKKGYDEGYKDGLKDGKE